MIRESEKTSKCQSASLCILIFNERFEKKIRLLHDLLYEKSGVFFAMRIIHDIFLSLQEKRTISGHASQHLSTHSSF